MKTIKLILITLLISKFISAQTEFDYLGQTPPGETPKEFAPTIITGEKHSTIAISPKGDEIFWVINAGGDQIYYSKLNNETWTSPALADFVLDYSAYQNSSPVFTPDGKRLFFCSNRPGGLGDYDTWYIEKTDSGWSEPINPGEPYNTNIGDRSPIFTNNGKAFRMGGGLQYSSASLCFKYTDNTFSEPEPFEVISGIGPCWDAFISPDENFLIYSKEKSGNNFDLYISFKNGENKWGVSKSLGANINTNGVEFFPVVSPDGKYLFYISGSSQKMFWVSTSIIDALRPTGLMPIKSNSDKLNIYPNPAQNTLQVVYPGLLQKEANYKIIDLNGRTMQQGKLTGTIIDVSKIKRGTYLLKLIIHNECMKQIFIIE